MDAESPSAKAYSHIEVNGAKLAYRDLGQGEPMVLIHANISDIRSWEPVENTLAEKFRVIAYSRRYAWPNEPIADDADDPWEGHADDLAALVEKLGIAPIHAVGNSTGAYVALLLARRRPELFRTMILGEPPVISVFLPRTPPGFLDVLKLLYWQPWAFLPVIKFGAGVIGPTTTAFKKGDDETALQTFARGVLGEESYAKLSDARRDQCRANVKPHGALFRGSSGLPPFLEDDARGVTVSTLLITGEKTVGCHRHINRRLVELIPGGKESVISDASHLMHEDNPSGTVKAILSFIEAQRP